MGSNIYPAASGGLTSAIKSIQSGSASTAGTITITSVNTSKAVVESFSTGSAGAVSVSGGMNGMNIGLNAASYGQYGLNPWMASDGATGAGLANNSYWWLLSNNSTGAIQNAYWAQGQQYYSPLNSVSGLNSGYGVPNAFTQATGPSAYGMYTPINGNAANGSSSGANFNNGTTSLTAAQYGAYLTNSTTITVTGPCQWQVVEYN
jgi:hypothetical protein